jgi:hypothetical protein
MSDDALQTLIYELLDAHSDTAALSAGLEADEPWKAHLDYLRDLQRVTRRVLACSGEWSASDRVNLGPGTAT